MLVAEEISRAFHSDDDNMLRTVLQKYLLSYPEPHYEKKKEIFKNVPSNNNMMTVDTYMVISNLSQEQKDRIVKLPGLTSSLDQLYTLENIVGVHFWKDYFNINLSGMFDIDVENTKEWKENVIERVHHLLDKNPYLLNSNFTHLYKRFRKDTLYRYNLQYRGKLFDYKPILMGYRCVDDNHRYPKKSSGYKPILKGHGYTHKLSTSPCKPFSCELVFYLSNGNIGLYSRNNNTREIYGIIVNYEKDTVSLDYISDDINGKIIYLPTL